MEKLQAVARQEKKESEMTIDISVPKGLKKHEGAKRQNHATLVKPKIHSREEDGKKMEIRYALIEIKYGPDPRGPKKCIQCGREFKKGEAWRRVWDIEHTYAIGDHNACHKQ